MSHMVMGIASQELSIEDRVIAGARLAIARWGVRRSSVDDIARDAGVSRASVYRCFPGGKEAVIAALVRQERSLVAASAVGSTRPDLESCLGALIVNLANWFGNNAALQFVLEHEQDLIGHHLGFATSDPLVAAFADLIAPVLAPFVQANELVEASEWLVRLLKSHLLDPSAFVALADIESVLRLVRTFIIPALDANSN